MFWPLQHLPTLQRRKKKSKWSNRRTLNSISFTLKSERGVRENLWDIWRFRSLSSWCWDLLRANELTEYWLTQVLNEFSIPNLKRFAYTVGNNCFHFENVYVQDNVLIWSIQCMKSLRNNKSIHVFYLIWSQFHDPCLLILLWNAKILNRVRLQRS